MIFRFVLRNGSSATPTGSTTGAGPPPRRLRFRGDGLMTDSEDDLVKIQQRLLTCKNIFYCREAFTVVLFRDTFPFYIGAFTN